MNNEEKTKIVDDYTAASKTLIITMRDITASRPRKQQP